MRHRFALFLAALVVLAAPAVAPAKADAYLNFENAAGQCRYETQADANSRYVGVYFGEITRYRYRYASDEVYVRIAYQNGYSNPSWQIEYGCHYRGRSNTSGTVSQISFRFIHMPGSCSFSDAYNNPANAGGRMSCP